MVDNLRTADVSTVSVEEAASLRNRKVGNLTDDVDLKESLAGDIIGDLAVSKGDVTTGLIEATRAISTVLSVGLPALAFRGKPTLTCPHPKVKLTTDGNDGSGSATTTRKGVKPKVTKKQAEKAAKAQAEKDAKRRAKRDLQTQQNGIDCAGGCRKDRGDPKVKLSAKGKIVDEIKNPNGTTTFRATATAKGTATVQCRKR